MHTVWNNGNDRNGRGSFSEHAERMRLFSKSHARDPEARVALLEHMPTLQVGHTATETGGLKGLTGMTDGLALIPMPKVALARFSRS